MKSYLALTAALIALALTGCSEDAPQSSTAPASTGSSTLGTAPSSATSVALPTHVHTASGPIRLAFVTNNASDYWTICNKGVMQAVKDTPGVTAQFVMPADGTAATQTTDVNDLLVTGVDGIAISPVDPANETKFLNKVAAKTNLITSDSDAASSNRLCYIGTDNHAAGLMAGGLIKQALPNGGKIVLFVGKSDAQNAKDRIQGITDALAGSGITIVDTRTDDADHARAKANASDALVKYPDLAGEVGIWSYNGPAILSAVQDAGKTGKIKIVAFDQEDGTIAGLRAGSIFGTVVQQPYEFGYNSVKLLTALAKGDKSGLPVNGLNIVPTQAITPANVDSYMKLQDKLLGKS